jgi:hypothetical protein
MPLILLPSTPLCSECGDFLAAPGGHELEVPGVGLGDAAVGCEAATEVTAEKPSSRRHADHDESALRALVLQSLYDDDVIAVHDLADVIVGNAREVEVLSLQALDLLNAHREH